MKLFFTIVYIRIISLRWKFDDHPLVEYPLCFCNETKMIKVFIYNILKKCEYLV